MEATSIKAVPLTREAYKRYGSVIGASDELSWRPANMGTARRFNHLADVENLRGDKAKLNLCVFSVQPLPKLPLEMRILEKHPLSTQVFMPMSKDALYLAIVCLGGDKPDLSTLTAFLVEGPQGVSYYPGVWHYPMTALERQLDFSCLVYENDTKDDCIIVQLDHPISVTLE